MKRLPPTSGIARRFRLAIGALLAIALASCATTQAPDRAPDQATDQALCAVAGVRVELGFERAAAKACSIRRTQDGAKVIVRIAPEITPINPSPWYAFKLASGAARPVEVELRYLESAHRYQPWIKSGSSGWSRLAQAPQLREDGRVAGFTVDVDATGVTVAAQPIQTVAEALAPFKRQVAAGLLAETVLGVSHDGREIIGFETLPEAPSRMLVMMSRQHPPETTGAFAFDVFAARILSDTEDAAAFRRTTKLVFVPMTNPDGAVRGHWRGNARGVDINRDWGPFRQPEPRAIRDFVAARAGSVPVAGVLDFHSTQRSVVYAPPADRIADDLADAMLQNAARTLGADMPPISRAHNSNGGTSKGWALETYGVGGLTLEFADDADAAEITRQATAMADGVMAAAADADARGAAGVAGARRFLLTTPAGADLPIWYLRPETAGADAPVVFVMHGVGRDADRYLREWAPLAVAGGFIVVTPEMTQAAFPGADGYNLGAILDAKGATKPRDQWSYSVIEPAFDAVRQREQLTTERYSLYGHSAGAQFVHRFVLFTAGPRLREAVSANAGWYTAPTSTAEWPYGLRGAPAPIDVAAALSVPMTLLLGDADTDPNDPNLRTSPEAMKQGPFRFARGQFFYQSALEAAKAARVQANWSCVIAPGVGHDNGAAAAFAVPLLTGDDRPSAGTPCVRAATPASHASAG
ncbi:hypothetical protein GC169_11675 [bacterium]|nr:hypothetical protein [bacterium]